MNEVQRSEVEKIGFGSILKMEISELPARLGRWVVENYNARSNTLQFPKDREMHITKEDVYIVLGWPNGGQRIECNKSNKDRILLEKWRLKFGRKDGKITAGDVVEKMLMCKDGGEWFIRHFMVLIVAVLIDSTSHGYMNALVLDHLRNVQEVFYVDRVAVYTRSMPRMFPAVVGWTAKTLRERENTEVKDGGFGIGHDDGRLGAEQRIVMVNTMDDDAQEHESSANESDAPVDLVVEDSEESLLLDDDPIWSSPEVIAAVDLA
ncbi:unnamed protein product [Cuscuta campestris]|uniref:Uncharacterized protein n=1 Tax=Cuscuta campestris TaxID=132261 RepID=A0A484MAD1_9ASTE|nr:unnamed protein product [Cuscuta campestris]